MKRIRPGLRQTLLGILALGAIAVAWVIAIEIAVLVAAVFIGLATAFFSGWTVGLIVGALSYVMINKILWYFDIFDMITSGRPNRSESASKFSPSETQEKS